MTLLNFLGNALMNISYLNGSWPSGYYWGELTLKNNANETSSGWVWFNVQPFRVSSWARSYSLDLDQCVNASIEIYEPDWYSYSYLSGNYSISSVYEDVWSGYSNSRSYYNNFTNISFNNITNVIICPNNGAWTSGSWGGYHYLTMIINDNWNNATQSGWLSFRTVPFTVSWSSISGSSKTTTSAVAVNVTLTKPSSQTNGSGNLTKLYQWRYSNYQSSKEEYVFKVGNCWSNVSRTGCNINGTQQVTIYPPSNGWNVGWNYLYAEWTQATSTAKVEDWSQIYFEARETYNGYFNPSDLNSNYKYEFAVNENLTTKLYVRDDNYAAVGTVAISKVEYAYSENCWSESCRSYTTATYSPTSTTNGQAVLNIKVNSSGWTKGMYAIKATVGNGVIITGGTLRVKDFVGPNVTINSPVNNRTYNTSFTFNATTTEASQCYLYVYNYNNFNNWYCGGWNATNSTNSSVSNQTLRACNTTLYNLSGSTYYYESLYKDWHTLSNGSDWYYPSGYLNTGGLNHYYTFNIGNWTNQAYGLVVYCYDVDYNGISEKSAFRINNTGV
jgi:hypothetical protein